LQNLYILLLFHTGFFSGFDKNALIMIIQSCLASMPCKKMEVVMAPDHSNF